MWEAERCAARHHAGARACDGISSGRSVKLWRIRQGELCTPTGAALLKHFADAFGPMPMMVTERTGIGSVQTFDQANCVRVFLGETVGKG